jgi:uncharacterized membrane protein YfcA
MLIVLGYLSAFLVGISLGLIGSGGSILAVPILVELLHIDPIIATAYSLFIVGTTSLVGSVKHIAQKKIDYRIALIFGIPSILSIYVTRIKFLSIIPDVVYSSSQFTISKSLFLLVSFTFIMLLAAISMILPQKAQVSPNQKIGFVYALFLGILGLLVGVIAGFVGAGGGFLIIPALVLLGKIPFERAIVTSLFIVCLNSIVGFLGVIQIFHEIDWELLTLFSGIAIGGLFVGMALAKKIPGEKMKPYFGWFILILGIYLMVDTLFLKE